MRRLIFATLLILGLAPERGRADDPIGLLASAQQAQAARAFEGVVVFIHDGKFDALKVVHQPGQNGYQHVSSLSGAPRALFRDAREARLEVAGAAQRLPEIAFPQRAFDSERISASYRMSESGGERIAGFVARVVDAVARDDVRYSQRLWINPETGLLLGVALFGPRREPLQQVMFTSLALTAAGAVPQAVRPEVATAPSATESRLALPPGFQLIAERVEGTRRSLIMSDGLAMITLYLEQRPDVLDRLTTLRRGATQLAARQRGHLRAVAVGEVPSATVIALAGRAVSDLDE